MGIYGALSSAVTGLRAQAHALENISGNIANSQTTAYKRIETDFVDLIPDAPTKRQVPGAVLAQSRGTNEVRGDIKTVSSETFVALNSNGFFVVEPKVGQSDGNAVFSGTNFYTRRGDFELDKDGRLVNGAGYYLKGLPVDRATGNVSGSVPAPIQISNGFLGARQSSVINYEANLPQMPRPAAYDGTDPATSLLQPAPRTPEQFLAQSIEGGSVTLYAKNGAPADVQLRWAKTAHADPAAAPPVAEDKWTLFYYGNDGTENVWTEAGEFAFGPDGTMTEPTGSEITIPGVNVNGTAIGDVKLQFGKGGLTQFDDVNGTADVSTLSQDGYAAGEFVSVAISDSGRVVATYSNGKRIDVAQVVTAEFNAINKLKRLDGGVYATTSESGEAILDLSGGGIIGGALEASNTDISDEFTKLIVTQQAYAAGTRIVSTADEMLQEALNMIR
jgi:flagellar hook protein FlgE